MVRVVLGIVLYSIVGLANVCAFVGSIEMTPSQPREDESIAIVLTAGYCDALFDKIVVARKDSFVSATVYGVQGTLGCAYPTLQYTFQVGSFPAGNYVLQLDYSHHPPGLPDNVTVETLDTLQFTVSPAGGSGTSAVPVASLPAFLLMALALAWTGVRRRRRMGRLF
jgi:hypothetical protein